MFDDLDGSLQFDAVASYLSLEAGEASDLLESLAMKLEAALPQHTDIRRTGGLFSRKKSVQEITVDFDDATWHLARTQRGGFAASVRKKVRGVVLKTDEIPVSQWIDGLAQELVRNAEQNAETRDALQRMVRG
jgi:hypothetical protein